MGMKFGMESTFPWQISPPLLRHVTPAGQINLKTAPPPGPSTLSDINSTAGASHYAGSNEAVYKMLYKKETKNFTIKINATPQHAKYHNCAYNILPGRPR